MRQSKWKRPVQGGGFAGASTRGDGGCVDTQTPVGGCLTGQYEAPCGCNVLGGNTFALAPNGALSGALSLLAIDSGDSCRWQANAALIVAYQADAVTIERLAAPIVQSPVLLTNARIGTVPAIRRTGQNSFGIISDGYSDRKEMTCVDWPSFTSTQNQGLTLELLNIGPTANHIFVILWGAMLPPKGQ